MMMSPSSPTATPPRWILLSTTIILAWIFRGESFQIIDNLAITQSCRRTRPSSPPSPHTSLVSMMSATSFQRARLAEQLRLSTRSARGNNGEITASETAPSDATQAEATAGAGAVVGVSVDGDASAAAAASSADEKSEEARMYLELENQTMVGLDDDGMPFSPMMTYQKYLTMQEKRVKVTIRYSAEAGLRPFYLTVASQIKSTHPDVLLEKRLLPPLGSKHGADDAIFEVVVDGKTIIGKKKTKMLKVTSTRSPRMSGGDDDGGEGDDGDGEKKSKGSGGGEANTPDIAGGRSIFVSMEKLEQELTKARKRRRPNTMYKSKEIATGNVMGGDVTSAVNYDGVGDVNDKGSNNAMALSTGLTEAVIRLEKLKAMSSRIKN